jgi:hypothetical protein
MSCPNRASRYSDGAMKLCPVPDGLPFRCTLESPPRRFLRLEDPIEPMLISYRLTLK